jgi:hypothetical protein
VFDTVLSSVGLFFSGKLFQDTALATRLLLAGALLGAVVTVGLGLFVPLWAAAVAGGLASGLVQPWLYRNIKYA